MDRQLISCAPRAFPRVIHTSSVSWPLRWGSLPTQRRALPRRLLGQRPAVSHAAGFRPHKTTFVGFVSDSLTNRAFLQSKTRIVPLKIGTSVVNERSCCCEAAMDFGLSANASCSDQLEPENPEVCKRGCNMRGSLGWNIIESSICPSTSFGTSIPDNISLRELCISLATTPNFATHSPFGSGRIIARHAIIVPIEDVQNE